MNRTTLSFHGISLQNVWSALKGKPLPQSMNTPRLLWIITSLALFVFAAFAGCLTAYLFAPHKLSGRKRSFPSSDKSNDLNELVLSSSPNDTKTKDLTHSIPTTISKEGLNQSSKKPLNIAFSNLTSKEKDTKEAVTSFNHSPDLDYDQILDFLKKHGNELKSLNLEKFNCTDDEFKAFIQLCPQIQHLFVSSHAITDEALEHLKGMPLTSVYFSSSDELTDKALEHLQGMPLTSVDFSFCNQLTDKALEHLKGMPLKNISFSSCKKITHTALKDLRLSSGIGVKAFFSASDPTTTSKERLNLLSQKPLNIDVSDPSSKKEDTKGAVDSNSFAQSPTLDNASLPGNPFIKKASISLNNKRTASWINDNPDVSLSELGMSTYDEILDFLKNHGNQLKSLNLGKFKCTDDAFKAFIQLCPQIQHLFVSSSAITDKALEHLKGIPLTSVNFSYCQLLTNKALEHLKRMPLTSVNFTLCKLLTDKALEHLKGMPLTSVDFSHCDQLTDKTLEHLKGLPLTNVNFFRCKLLTDKALEHLKGMPLTSVNFILCKQLTDNALEHLKGMPLTSVNFGECNQLTDKTLEHLKGMPLTSANFSYCQLLTDKALEHLKGMPLTSVYFAGCNQLTDKALEHLKGKPLTRVHFGECNQLTDKALEHLKGMPLENISFSSCKKITDNALKDLRLSCGI